MSSEKKLIEICKRLIEEKLHLPQNESWKQRDFEYLSEIIFDKTRTRISISTLKRIWKNGSIMPQTYTLNVLTALLGYESWTDFKKENVSHLAEVQEKREETEPASTRNTYLPYWALITVLLLTICFFIFYQERSVKSSDWNSIVFKNKTNLKSGVPNTVVFEYDISKINFDSAFIQQSWDNRMRAKINKDNHFQTFIYYYPGYHVAKLIIDGKIVKRDYVNITTNGWEALVDGNIRTQVPIYIASDSIIHDGKLYVPKKTLINSGLSPDSKDFFVNYFNVGKFAGANAANFTFETRLKNNLKEGALTCQYVQLTIICQNGMISVPFCNPGCSSNIHLHAGDIFINGKNNDLSAFGLDLSIWENIKIKTVTQQVAIYANNKNIYKIKFNKDLGKITGLQYNFYGCGAVDMVKLYDSKNNLCYSDVF